MAWVVEQARLRGIRVELELDFPAHASSFCRGYPELCANVSGAGQNGGHCGLDVSKNRTFEFIDGLVQELGTAAAATAAGSAQAAAPSAAAAGPARALFPEQFFHFGGDEVDTRCWGPPSGGSPNISGSYEVDMQIWRWLLSQGNLSTIGARDLGSYGVGKYNYYLSEALGYCPRRPGAVKCH